MKKRFWALFLAVMMVVSVLPTSAFAEDGESVDKNLQPDPLYYSFEGKEVDEEDADITLSKTAVYKGDGTYEVTLSATAEEVIRPKPTEVVFVLDASGSMRWCTLKHKYEGGNCNDNCPYTNGNFHDADARWHIATNAIASMSTALKGQGASVKYVAFNNNDAAKQVDSYSVADLNKKGFQLASNTQTYLMDGVRAGIGCFTSDADTNKVLIIVADGDSSDGYSDTRLTNFRNGANNTVYTVGFTFSSDNFKEMATSDEHYYNATNEESLNVVLGDITEKIVGLINDPMGSKVNLDEDSVEISEEGLPEATIDGSTINWTDSKGLDGTVTLTYEVTIKSSEQKAGTLNIPLNGAAKLNYTYNNNNYAVAFPIPTAVIEAATLDVSYMLDGKKVDNDHEWINLTEGDVFEITVPEVGGKHGDYWVTGVEYVGFEAAELDNPAAEAYTVIVTLTNEEPINEYGYTVEYYFDGEQNEDLTEELEAEFGAEINSYPNKAGKDYCLDHDTAPITIGADASENVIKVYYAKDVWNDETNQDDMGDGIPDKYQVRIKYVSRDPEKGTVTKKNGTPALDVITLYDAAGAYATAGDVTTSEATATATESNGFKNWTDYNGFEMAAEDETLSAQTIEGAKGGETYTYTAIFSAATQPDVVKIPYYIEHYQEQLDGTYVKVETETKFDVNEKEITIADADYKAYANYTPNKTHEDAVLSGTVGVSVDTSGDAPVATMLTLKLYYDLDEYTVTFVDEDGETILKEATEYAYGTKAEDIAKPADPTKADDADYTYAFAGWTPAIADVTANATYKATYSATPREAKLSVEEKVLMTAGEIKAGDTITWKITVQNDGNKDAQLVAGLISDTISYSDTENGPWTVLEGTSVTFPETLPVVEAGKTADIEVTWTVPASVVGKYIKNAAKINGEEGGKETPPTYVIPEPAVSIEKKADKTSVKVGDKVTYTITVKNEGNVDLTGVKVTDTFVAGGKGTLTVKSGSLEIGTLAVGETAAVVLEYTTVADDVNGLKNQAEVDTNEIKDVADTEEVKVTKKPDPVRPVGPSKPALNKADHYAYIVGYPDGLVHPEKNITRAEVSTIFFRMLLDESRENFWAQENWFSDVPAHMWFNNAVSTLANAGLITGYPDGSFKPNANITRAEFATIAIRFFLEEDVEITENNLTDVKGHWAEANINLAYALNLITGYPDGTFRPDQKITRAEAMTIVNRVLERAPEKDHLLDDMIEWPDNLNKDAWYYADVQEATNSHEFYRDSENEHEVWTELLPVRDWAALEQEWSQANSSKNPGEVVDINISTPEAGN